jgi:hypothetical protein
LDEEKPLESTLIPNFLSYEGRGKRGGGQGWDIISTISIPTFPRPCLRAFAIRGEEVLCELKQIEQSSVFFEGAS